MGKIKDDEDIVFEIFNNQILQLKSGEYLHKDRPDFWVKNLRYDVGIEITQIFHDLTSSRSSGSRIKETESIQSNLIKKIETRIRNVLPSTPLQIDLEFKSNNLRFSQKDEFISKVIELTKSHYKELNFLSEFDYLVINDPLLIPDELFSIELKYYENINETRVSIAGAYWAPKLKEVHIGKAIESKSHLITQYQRFKEYWLILAVNTNRTSDFEIPVSFDIQLNNSKFERIYIVDVSNNRVINLS